MLYSCEINVFRKTSLIEIIEATSLGSSTLLPTTMDLECGKGGTDAPPSSLMDSIVSPKVKTTKGERNWGAFPGS